MYFTVFGRDTEGKCAPRYSRMRTSETCRQCYTGGRVSRCENALHDMWQSAFLTVLIHHESRVSWKLK